MFIPCQNKITLLLDDAVLSPYVVMAVPEHVVVSMGGFPINVSGECSIMF